jgi:hypothetical protein
MVRMMEVLLAQYGDRRKLYLSWDAASWHVSKKLFERIDDHNFYAGYVGRGIGQLCLTIFTLGYLGVISWIWAIIEICIVEKDSTGLNFN